MTDLPIAENLPQMYRVALRYLGDADKAEEAVQNACVKALQNRDGFAGNSSPMTWLHRLTVNCSIDLLRRNGRSSNARPMAMDELGGVERFSQSNPALAAERKELGRIAGALVAELPDDCRTSFVLTQLDGYSYDEAAEIENVARGTVASRVFRAKKQLASAMAESIGEEVNR